MTSGILKERGVKESGISNAWGVEHFGISECMGGKISMPPVVGVQTFSGTTH